MSSFSIGQHIANRYKIQQPLPSTNNIQRFQVLDTHNNQLFELVTPTGTALLRPNASAHFLETHRNATANDAIFDINFVGEHNGRPFYIRPTTANVLQTEQQPIESLYPMAQWLIPSLLGAAQHFPDGLHPEDIVLTPDGEPYLQPAGIVNTEKLGNLNLYRSEGTPEQAALYGLGVILFQLASGTKPFKTNSPSDLKRLQQTPPRLSEFMPDVPEDLDALVFQLMSPDPSARLPNGLPPIDSPPKLKFEVAHQRLQPKRQPKSTTRTTKPRKKFMIMAPANLPNTLKRSAAAFGQLNESIVLNETGPFPISTTDSESEAQAQIAILEEIGIQATVMETSAPAVLLPLLGLSAFSGFLPVLGYFLLSYAGLGVGLLASVIAFIIGAISLSKRSKPAINAQWVLLQRPATSQEPAELALYEARVGIINSKIPGLAKLDLLDSLNRLQEIWDNADSTSLSPSDMQSLVAAAQQLEDAAASYISNDNIQASVKQVQKESQFIRRALARDLE